MRERAINAPLVVLLLIAMLLASHVLRLLAGVDSDRFALTSDDLAAGRYGGLLTYQFVHGGWAHLALNSVFILAFGAPVARFFGAGPRGGAVFLVFFLFCGGAAAAAYAVTLGLVAPSGPPWALVGASGAASGLMGAAARLIEGQGRPGSLFGRTVIGMTFGWIVVNAVLGISGLSPGAGDTPVAWQAHILGYFCGLLTVGLAGAIAGVKPDHANAL